MLKQALFATLFACILALILPYSGASYNVTHLNVTITLNSTTAQVVELYTLYISNSSINQYQTSRLALNITLSSWQKLVGPELVQHIINPTRGATNFEFLPGPVFRNYSSGAFAYLRLSYDVPNSTTVSHAAPREFAYVFNPKIFNFQSGVSGEVLTQNTSLNILIPQNARITAVFPLPDNPVYASESAYSNTTKLTWNSGEPLSKFTLSYTLLESMQAEVTGFFTAIYHQLGIYVYLIIAALVILFILYAYLKAIR